MSRIRARAAALASLVLLVGCGGADGDSTGSSGADPSTQPGGLTQTELEQGIGPVRDMQLGTLDPQMAARGEDLFTTKCSACHKLAERYVAPPLGDVLSRRRPEFVMNMILNAGEMVQRHPVVQQLLAEYYTPMPVQVTDRAQARAILEYLRSAQTGAASTTSGSNGG